MSRVCEICGRGPQVGNHVSHAHNVNKRRFEINLQQMRVVIDGTTKRIKVCTRCIQAGKIVRPQFQPGKRKQKELEPKLADFQAAAVEDEAIGKFFSSKSIVDTIFKKKKKLEEEEVEVEELETPTDETEDEAPLPVVVEVERIPLSETAPYEPGPGEL